MSSEDLDWADRILGRVSSRLIPGITRAHRRVIQLSDGRLGAELAGKKMLLLHHQGRPRTGASSLFPVS